jgi:hypothetical protein
MDYTLYITILYFIYIFCNNYNIDLNIGVDKDYTQLLYLINVY